MMQEDNSLFNNVHYTVRHMFGNLTSEPDNRLACFIFKTVTVAHWLLYLSETYKTAAKPRILYGFTLHESYMQYTGRV